MRQQASTTPSTPRCRIESRVDQLRRDRHNGEPEPSNSNRLSVLEQAWSVVESRLALGGGTSLHPDRKSVGAPTSTGHVDMNGVPLHYRSPWTRPLPMVATAIAATIAAFLIIGNVTDRPTQAVPVSAIGSCVTVDGLTVSCDDSLAADRLMVTNDSAEDCMATGWSTSFTSRDTHQVFCAQALHR